MSPFGAVGGERDYLVGNTVHDVISLAAPTTILDNWQQGKVEQDFENIAKTRTSTITRNVNLDPTTELYAGY